MPELPEVETIRLQLSRLISGLTVKKIQLLKHKSFIGDKKLLFGVKVKGLRRFGKLLVIDFNNGLSLAVHLKMTGQLIYRIKNYELGIKNEEEIKLSNKHTRVIIEFTNGDRLYFNDIRRFGWVRLVRNKPITQLSNNPINKLYELNNLIKYLGPDPLSELTTDKFHQILESSSRPIKLLLMDQQQIAGVGNIYANEALFLPRINPRKKANELSSDQAIKLLKSLKKVLRDGIRWGGASRTNFVNAYGRKGQVQEHFYVYDREGKNCPNDCGEKILKIKLGGRGTYFCPKCQR